MEQEMTTDEAIMTLDENYKFACQRIKEEIETFNNNFTFEMPEKYKGFIQVKATGKKFSFRTYRGMRIAFKRASFTCGAQFNQFIVGKKITVEEYW